MSPETAFELQEGRIWIEARVSGRSAWGIFDTGADGTALDSEFAQSIGLRGLGSKSASTVAADVEVEKIGRVEFDIGGMPVLSPEAHALPLSKQLKDLRFILGFDVLGNAPFVIMPERKRITFEWPEECRGLPFVVDSDIRPTARLEVLGHLSYGSIDTGSAQGISLPRRWVEANATRLGISSGVEESKEILGGTVKSLKFTLEEMILGDSTLRMVPANAVESEEGSFAEQSSLWGNVGNQVLQRFESIAIDGKGRRMAFELTS
jgi:hypothetical protein